MLTNKYTRMEDKAGRVFNVVDFWNWW